MGEDLTSVLYSAANDPRPEMIPRPQMISKMDRKWTPTANDPWSEPQMILLKERNGVEWSFHTERNE